MELERTIAGHAVLRRLADGTRSSVWLAADDLVLKVLTPPVPPDALAREVEALARAAGDHVAEVVDVASGDEAAVLVLRRLARGSLADLLRRRGAIEAGEAVTILVPVARALARMHAAGVAHGALSPADVHFRADGAPVLTGFGSALLFRAGLPEIEREREAGVRADRAALRGLAVTVLDRVGGARAAAAGALGATLAEGDADLEERVARGLFELAAARPVAFAEPEEHGGSEQSIAAGPRRAVGVEVLAPLDERTDGEPASLRRVVESVIAEGPRPLARSVLATARRRWVALPAPRRRLAIALAAGAGSLLALGVLVPSSGPSSDPGVAALPEAGGSGGPESTPVDTLHDDLPEDPVLAVIELLDRRRDCLRELSILCLDGVVQPGSAAERDDRSAIEALVESGEQPIPISGEGARLVERLGGSALVALAPDSDPASVLLMRTEAGWRVRDYLAAGAGVGG